MEILVRKDFSPEQVKRAELARSEFKPNRFTSGSARVDDLAALDKAILLCDSHARKFWPRGAKAMKYETHPDPKLRNVFGNCDVCQVPGPGRLFICSKDAVEHRKNWEAAKRAMEYGTFITG